MNLLPRLHPRRPAILAALTSLLLAYSILCPANRAQAQAVVPVQTSPWTLQQSGTTASLRGVYSVDGKVAWASGTSGAVLRTTDGGRHWQTCSIPPEAQSLGFRGIQAWDADRALVMASGPGDKSRIFKTTDGCKSWTLLFKNPDAPNGFFDSFSADWSEEGGTP